MSRNGSGRSVSFSKIMIWPSCVTTKIRPSLGGEVARIALPEIEPILRVVTVVPVTVVHAVGGGPAVLTQFAAASAADDRQRSPGRPGLRPGGHAGQPVAPRRRSDRRAGIRRRGQRRTGDLAAEHARQHRRRHRAAARWIDPRGATGSARERQAGQGPLGALAAHGARDPRLLDHRRAQPQLLAQAIRHPRPSATAARYPSGCRCGSASFSVRPGARDRRPDALHPRHRSTTSRPSPSSAWCAWTSPRTARTAWPATPCALLDRDLAADDPTSSRVRARLYAALQRAQIPRSASAAPRRRHAGVATCRR